MGWEFTTDVETYANAAGALLATDPAAHTISLTVIETARARPVEDEIYGWWSDADGRVTGAVSHTPPHPLLLGVVPDDALRPLVDRLADRPITGVNGASALAAQVAAVWTATTGRRAELGGATRLFRLGTLLPPDPMPAGKARPATEADVDLLVDWVTAFSAEAVEPGVDVRPSVLDRLSFGGWTIWEDGVPVSVAGRTRIAAGVARIAPVYTPPEHRRHGYAAAVTAAASQAARDAGAGEVVLFTDLTNPTSNGVYKRIGYVPVTDRLVALFTD